jgi:lipopolysaccharide transport system permease protein
MDINSHTQVTHIRPERGAGVLDPMEIWRYRVLLRQMITRNIRSRVISSPMSLIWGFIRPGIMTLAFFYIRHMSSADFGGHVPYALFIFSGLCVWFLFSEVTVQVAGSLSADAAVSQKVYFPRVLSPLAIVLARWIDIIVIVAAIIIMQFFFSVPVTPDFLLVLPAMATLLLLAFGLGCLFAGLMLYHPDNRKFLETMLYLGLFLSPVLFAKSILPEVIQQYYVLNPIVGALSAVRGSLFAPEPIDGFAWLVSVIIALCLTGVGLGLLSWAAKTHGERV